MQCFTSVFPSYPIAVLLLCGFVITLHNSCLAIYRLFFHPLNGFPGPRLARITTLYKTYYEVVKGGELLQKIRELHEVYGEKD
jgi:hypothetical protein